MLGGGVALLASATLGWLWLAKAPTPRPEIVPLPIPLTGGPELTEAEISGLAWVGDSLVLLPQYPASFGGSVFVIDRAEIERVLSAPDGDPISARRVPLDAPALEQELPGFDGFEAIAVDGDDVFVTVETRRGSGASSGYVLAGRVQGDLERIVIDPTRRAELLPQNDLVNTSYEALVVHGDRVLAIYETNGEVNPSPRVLVFDRFFK